MTLKSPRLLDLVTAVDGSLSMTKLGACTGHLLFAIGFLKFQIIGGTTYSEGLWAVYAGICLGHAVIDKTSAQVAAFKDKQQDIQAETAVPPADTTVATKETEPDGTTKTKTVTHTAPTRAARPAKKGRP